MRGIVTVAAAVVAGSLATASTAPASSVSRSGGLLLYLAAPGEHNQVSIKEVDGAVTVTDRGATIEPGAMCRTDTGQAPEPPARGPVAGPAPSSVRCAADLLTAVVVLAGDQPDTVDIQLPSDVLAHVAGGTGNDVLTADAGASVLQGEDGDDRIELVGSPDALDIAEGGAGDDLIDAVAGAGSTLVRCGPGFDIVELDQADRPSDGCEGRSYPAPRTVADVLPVPPPDPVSNPALVPTAPRLPGGGAPSSSAVTATAPTISHDCLLRPRKRHGKLTVRLTGIAGHGDVYYNVFKTQRHLKVVKQGVDPVLAGRREALTAIRARQGFTVGVETPVPCPNR